MLWYVDVRIAFFKTSGVGWPVLAGLKEKKHLKPTMHVSFTTSKQTSETILGT